LKLPGIVPGGHSNTRSQPRSTALGGYSKPGKHLGGGNQSTGGHSDTASAAGGGNTIAEAAKFKKLQDQIEIAEEELALLRKTRGEQLLAQNITRQCKCTFNFEILNPFV